MAAAKAAASAVVVVFGLSRAHVVKAVVKSPSQAGTSSGNRRAISPARLNNSAFAAAPTASASKPAGTAAPATSARTSAACRSASGAVPGPGTALTPAPPWRGW
ncbi:hypothetical protein [Nocardia gipuzkoensis]